MALHLRSAAQTNGYAPQEWGEMRSYVEIGDDLLATRRVDVYENGCRRKYDRQNPNDDFGFLGQMQYDQDKWEAWWGVAESVTTDEFEIEWMSTSL